LILVKLGVMFSLVLGVDGRCESMLRKVIILCLAVTLLWLSGCATVTPITDPGAAYGPCAQVMPYWYCGGP
jgi:hypothetical protein